MSYFDAFGPYEIRRKNGTITGAQKDFWNDIAKKYDAPDRAIGCYVFCLKFGKIIRPWYVGMTVADTGFRGEVFQQHKLDIYNECLRSRRGAPVMFLFPLMLASGAFSKAGKSKKKEIQWLEVTLMGFAHRRNPEISNIRDMTFRAGSGCLDSAPLDLSGFLPGHGDAGPVDFAVASGGRSPTRVAAKSMSRVMRPSAWC